MTCPECGLTAELELREPLASILYSGPEAAYGVAHLPEHQPVELPADIKALEVPCPACSAPARCKCIRREKGFHAARERLAWARELEAAVSREEGSPR